MHYTKPRTDVVISLTRITEDGRSVAQILVADRGDGVPEEALARLFEPFYRARSFAITDWRKRPGSSIAQRIAVLITGAIRARNRDGGGLKWRFAL